MKKTDIAAIVIISVISTIVAYLGGNAVLGDPSSEKVTIKYMDVINSKVAQPDPEVFSPTAINPTVEVYIGNCPVDQVWDEINRVCRDIVPETENQDNPEPNPENSETGE